MLQNHLRWKRPSRSSISTTQPMKSHHLTMFFITISTYLFNTSRGVDRLHHFPAQSVPMLGHSLCKKIPKVCYFTSYHPSPPFLKLQREMRSVLSFIFPRLNNPSFVSCSSLFYNVFTSFISLIRMCLNNSTASSTPRIIHAHSSQKQAAPSGKYCQKQYQIIKSRYTITSAFFSSTEQVI